MCVRYIVFAIIAQLNFLILLHNKYTISNSQQLSTATIKKKKDAIKVNYTGSVIIRSNYDYKMPLFIICCNKI